ncbi:Alpha/Beta hydrolase protein [Globomyces pollinis-pini]|nr:Alpha/Beta hydrolase protein [Globomyces pollinis-pini]
MGCYLLVWILYLRMAQIHLPPRNIFGVKVPLVPIHPKRILKVTGVFISALYSNIFGPPLEIAWIHIKNYFKNHELIFKDIDYGSLFPKTKLDVYAQQGSNHPVIIFIYGGAWSSGSKFLYAPVALNLRKMGNVVVLPDYTLFPISNPNQMIHEIQSIVSWTVDNISQYGGDMNNIVLMGHSAGAHLITLSYMNYSIDKISLSNPIPSLYKSITRPIEIHSELHHVKAVVLIAGPYDISDHHGFESQRGVEELSAMGRLFGHDHDSFHKWSPPRMLQSFSTNPIHIDSIKLRSYLPRKWLLIHSHKDSVVPFSSSSKLYDSLERIGIPHLSLKTHKGDHAELIYELFLGRGNQYDTLVTPFLSSHVHME